MKTYERTHIDTKRKRDRERERERFYVSFHMYFLFTWLYRNVCIRQGWLSRPRGYRLHAVYLRGWPEFNLLHLLLVLILFLFFLLCPFSSLCFSLSLSLLRSFSSLVSPTLSRYYIGVYEDNSKTKRLSECASLLDGNSSNQRHFSTVHSDLSHNGTKVPETE